jgi:Amt family ammonium transporter
MEPISLLEIRLDYIWILLSAALVFMMQAGFMCLESGLASAKNSINIAIKNLADFIVSAILFWAVGFGLMFGLTMGGWAGGSDFLVSMNDPWIAILFVFEVVFAGTAATIVSGAISGRTKFGAYLIISAVISGVIYPVFGFCFRGGWPGIENPRLNHWEPPESRFWLRRLFWMFGGLTRL